MTTPWEMYKQLDTPEGLELCPCCGSAAQLWQYSESATAPTSKVICCENAEQFGPQDGLVNGGCLLYMPPEGFYRPTLREAVKYWNEYAKALTSQQRARRWEAAQVLRSNAAMTGPAGDQVHEPVLPKQTTKD